MRRSYKYNIEKLKELDIKLVTEFDESEPKLYKTSKINGYCKTNECSNTFTKSFSNILNGNGPYCESCVRINNTTISTKQKYDWTQEKLKELGVELVKDYTQLGRRSIIEGICKTNNCNNIFSKKFDTIAFNGGAYCNDCCEKNRRDKITNSCKKKSKWTFQMLQDLNITLLQDYSKDSLTRESVISGICKNENCSTTFEKTFGTIIRNGGPYCVNCTNINLRKKMKETSIERYGVDNTFKAESVRQKIKNTNLERYGVEWASQTKETLDKMKQTCLKKYGVEHVSQNEEIYKKQQKACFHPKDYILPSGKIIRVQGYEPLVLDILLKTISEEELLTGYKNVPSVWYEMDGKKRRYYTDIFIPSQNKCIEVKSDFTFYKEKEKNLLKQKATKNLGYECEIWIFDKYKKLVEIIK